MKILIATARHLMHVTVEETEEEDPRNYRIVDTDVWLSDQTFATVTRNPETGAILTISHKDTVGSRSGKMQDMYITQFTAEGGILDQGHQPWLRHAHTAEFANGGLYVTNTAYNELAYIRDGQKQSIYIGPKGEDTHHINATWIDGDQVYVMAHNGNLPEDLPGQIFRVDHSDLNAPKIADVIELPHRKCHHFFPFEDGWVYTASDDGRIVYDDKHNFETNEVCVGGFPKGLQRVDDSLAVLTTSEHTPFIERRLKSHAQLGFLDLATFSVIEMLDLKVANQGAGQVNDLLVLPD